MNNERKAKLVRYLRETFMNKVVSIITLLIGVIAMLISGDGTVLLFTSLFAIPLFVMRENYIK